MVRREFQFSEGSSEKFWNIELNGKSFTVQYGRIGTAGQTQEKSFGSDADAKKAYEKLVAEKLKKGYVESGAGSAATSTATAPAKPAKVKKAAKESAPEAPAVPAAEPVPAAKPIFSTDIERRLHLSPGDMFLQTGERRTLGEPRPFDRELCLAALGRITKPFTYGAWDWTDTQIPDAIAAEEADFWLHALLFQTGNWHVGLRELVKEMKEYDPSRQTAVEEARKSLFPHKTHRNFVDSIIMLPLARLFPAEELFDCVRDQIKNPEGYAFGGLVNGFSRFVRPYLSEQEVKALRKTTAETLDPVVPAHRFARAGSGRIPGFPWEYFMAAALGMTAEVKQIVAALAREDYVRTQGWSSDVYQLPQFLILRLGDPLLVEAEMRRLDLLLRGLEQIQNWLAVTKWNALDVVRDSILEVGKREEAEALIVGFGKAIEAPEAAVTMLELKLQSKAPNVARLWLDEHLGHAVAGLIPVAGGKGKLADAATEFLLDKKRQGHADLIARLLKDAPPEVAAKVRHEVLDREEKTYIPFDAATTPDWLKDAAADLKSPKSADWLPVPSLPPILVDERRLNDAQLGQVFAALQKSALESVHALLSLLRQHADAEPLDAFAWAVFSHWLGAGGQSKDKWGMTVVGFLGGDRSVLKMTPLIRAWPGESQHPRAVLGLQCLRKIGSDTALMQLNGIAQKLKFKGLKEAAARFMEEIANDKGLSRAQLEDRIVPDCDLDERGARTFDFGPRKFRFVLGPQLKPMLKDESGAVKTDLPKPNSKDDAELANAAVAEWKLLKKQIGEVVKIQAVRLEQAMVTGRRWPAADFETMLVRHPLMINLVRQLLWAVYDKDGQVTKTFRITEDQTPADAEDKEMKLAKDEEVGIAHPLQLTEADKAAWGEILSDYEIVPPFAQRGRPTYALQPGEEAATEIQRFAKIKIPPQSLIFGLEKLGWTRGPAMDAGSFNEHIKFFPGANVTAIVTYEPGMSMGYMEGAEEQTIEHCFFLEGRQAADWYRRIEGALKLDSVDAVVVSEVLGDLSGIAAKGK